ncbi:hypothetical protein DPMN_107243 [Dreissena polymorpha]|uniref:Uncharacterized protein n=1 Tax=Dreissena polymorpha TaxID=45954 RepID=A0A9D4QKV0_DREPO|nr:hypothetical protein DPMN_107243 [Dreissena polymorpha]
MDHTAQNAFKRFLANEVNDKKSETTFCPRIYKKKSPYMNPFTGLQSPPEAAFKREGHSVIVKVERRRRLKIPLPNMMDANELCKGSLLNGGSRVSTPIAE